MRALSNTFFFLSSFDSSMTFQYCWYWGKRGIQRIQVELDTLLIRDGQTCWEKERERERMGRDSFLRSKRRFPRPCFSVTSLSWIKTHRQWIYIIFLCMRVCRSTCILMHGNFCTFEGTAVSVFCSCLWSWAIVLIRRLCKNSKQTAAEKERWEKLQLKHTTGYQFHSQTVAWQRGCHGNHSRQSVRVCRSMCVLHGRAEYAVKDWCSGLCVSVCVSLLGSLWDTVRRELCWLVKGPGGQKGNNTSSFPSFLPSSLPLPLSSLSDFFLRPLLSPPLPPLPSLFLVLSQRDEVRLGHHGVSGMTLGHQHAATSATLLVGGASQSSQRDYCAAAFSPATASRDNEVSLQLGRLRARACMLQCVCSCLWICQCRCGYEKYFKLSNKNLD